MERRGMCIGSWMDWQEEGECYEDVAINGKIILK
jgi:hypothetical protein